jgi:ribosomal peptide maturation radical SAM protein 1
MPFVGFERPSLGLSLLQAELRRRGVQCDVHYLTFGLVDSLGTRLYDWVAHDLPYTAFVGDWVFARALYGPDRTADREYVRRVLVREWHCTRAEIEQIFAVRTVCENFLSRCLSYPLWQNYDVVGFTSTFTQNLASLALARRLKQAFPGCSIVFGGANWEGEMGQALHAAFPFVDFACSGEAELSFPDLIAAIGQCGGNEVKRDSRSLFERIPGICFRYGDTSTFTGPGTRVRDLDSLATVTFDDYYRDWSNSRASSSVAPQPLLETSRGCWWGAKSHCTFCGLNGASMAFRSKSPDRVLSEIRELKQRYGATHIEVVDNILDMRYFKTLLPRLRDSGLDVRLFYEVKSNLKLDQVRLLYESGVHTIQPGIESFSDHVLELMRKGTTGLRNVQLLKWCREFGIRPEWNLLYGFPGESELDYAEMLPLLKAICFLDPPSGYGPVRLDRFSPYHQDPAAYGMINVRPMEPYRYLYPKASDSELLRTCYYFEYDLSGEVQPDAYAGPVVRYIQEWQRREHGGDLWLIGRADDDLLIWDERTDWPGRKLRLEGWRATAYLACDQVRSRKGLYERIGDQVSSEEVDRFLSLMVKTGLMARTGDRFLSLAVHKPRRERAHGAGGSRALHCAPAAVGSAPTALNA